MGEAAKISLKAIGKQDTHLLSKDPEDSLFKYNDHMRHSEFRKYHNVHTVTQGITATWPFGEIVRVELNPQNMGDLLNNIWIQMTLPKWGFDDIEFNETLQKMLFNGQTLAQFGYPTFRDWWAAGAPNTAGIILPVFQFPDFKYFLSFETQFNNLIFTFLPSELFIVADFTAIVLVTLIRILNGDTTTTPGVELINTLGINQATTSIPIGIINVFKGISVDLLDTLVLSALSLPEPVLTALLGILRNDPIVISSPELISITLAINEITTTIPNGIMNILRGIRVNIPTDVVLSTLGLAENVFLALLGILNGNWDGNSPGPELITSLGIDPETTTIPSYIINILNGTSLITRGTAVRPREVGADITDALILSQLDSDVFAVLPETIKSIILRDIPLPAFTLPEIAYWAWDMQLLGRKLIKNIKFKVDTQILEEITADWCIISDNMYTTESQKMSANTLYNRNITGGESSQPAAQNIAQSNDVFIHIPFFFTHSYGGDAYSENDQNKPPFPLCAIHKQKITLEIEFFKQSFFTLYNQRTPDNLSTRGPPVTPPPKQLQNFKIITEEITVSHEERLYFTRPNNEITYDFVVKHSSIPLEPEKREFVIQLEPSIPVKCFHWFFRYEGYENDGEYRSLPVPVDDSTYVNEWYYSTTANRYNFTRAQIKDMSEPHLLKSAFFTLNGERIPNVSNNDREYFFSYIPSRAKLARSATGIANNYLFEPPIPNYLLNYIYSYNFALFPKSASLSGFLDFSVLQSEKTSLHLELVDNTDLKYGNGKTINNPVYKFHMYYTGYKTLVFKDGFLLQG
jgi:hypothetical protein